ncbi:MAG: nicotinamide-nucleotide amidohydrolase family protein [Candidatus Omnitrophica bacterium]|nr:nicotinamide-nucleotide amidohydrolase family protein [Candidatus Omnitrophota bacterium]
MERTAATVHKLLISRRKTVSVAESCTGGLVSSLLTGLAGSSAYFMLGAVVYSNKAKQTVLGIRAPLLKRWGAVSSPVAEEMARAVRRLAKTDYGMGITGIAGPAGGSREKPVGTVFIAVAGKRRVLCRKFLFKGDRAGIQKQAAGQALRLLKNFLS